MDNIVENLKEYLDKTPRDQVEADWNKTAELDFVCCTVEEFIENTYQQSCKLTRKHTKLKKFKLGASCSRLRYFLNGEIILSLAHRGGYSRWLFEDEFILNGNLYITKRLWNSNLLKIIK